MPNLVDVVQPKKNKPFDFFVRRPYHKITDGGAYGEAFISIWDIHLATKADDVVKNGKTVQIQHGTFRRYLRIDLYIMILVFKWNYTKRVEKVEQAKTKSMADILNASQKKRPSR